MIPSGTTIGTANAKADYIYVYALDMVTAVELAVSLTKFDEGSIQSTTAISTGSSRSTLYSTTARTNVPVRLIGKIKSTQTTAGTWASAVSEISLTPFMAAKAPTVQPFTTGTSQTYTTPAGAVAIKVRMVGGGGGGGGVPAGNATNVSIAGGGGGGGYVEHLYSGSALLATFTYTVGGGGSFGTTTPTGGGAGGATTFGSLSANGGTGAAAGGNAGNTAVYFATGGQGGTASGGNIANATGSDGGHGISSAAVNQVFAGKGGASVLGGVSGNPLNIGAAGTTGYNYGGGGGGGATTISGGAVNGGAGAGGIIIVEEYYA